MHWPCTTLTRCCARMRMALALQGKNIYTTGYTLIISSYVGGGMELAAGSTTTYVLPAAPGHWVPAAKCEVQREPCPDGNSGIAIACRAAAASCSTNITNNVDTCTCRHMQPIWFLQARHRQPALRLAHLPRVDWQDGVRPTTWDTHAGLSVCMCAWHSWRQWLKPE